MRKNRICPLDVIGNWLIGFTVIYMLAQIIRFMAN